MPWYCTVVYKCECFIKKPELCKTTPRSLVVESLSPWRGSCRHFVTFSRGNAVCRISERTENCSVEAFDLGRLLRRGGGVGVGRGAAAETPPTNFLPSPQPDPVTKKFGTLRIGFCWFRCLQLSLLITRHLTHTHTHTYFHSQKQTFMHKSI